MSVYEYAKKSLDLATIPVSPLEETQRQRLERQKQFMQKQISDIDRALFLLEKYPEMEELQDLLRRV